MGLQKKILIGGLLIILVWSGIYLAFSVASVSTVLDRYEGFVQKEMAGQLQNSLIEFYQSNGGSWQGVENVVLPLIRQRGPHPMRLFVVLQDREGQELAAWPPRRNGPPRELEGRKMAIRLQLQADGETIGTLLMTDEAVISLEGTRKQLTGSLLQSISIAFLISSLVAVGVSYLLAKRLSQPLRQLVEATEAVKRRRFDLRLPVTSKDEVGTVIQAFNEMNEELQHNEQVRRNLVADVAHELRTPLTVIQGQLESIQQGVLPATVESLLPIQDEVIRLNRLVDDLRQLTLAEAGQLPLRQMEVDLRQCVQRIADNFQVITEGRQVQLEVRMPEAPLVVKVDPDRLTQIVVNLLDNAMRHAPAGGMVELGLGPKGPMTEEELRAFCQEGAEAGLPPAGEGALVWVADTGPGIAAEHLPYIFDRFYRSDGARGRGQGGAGLGLAIAREFVLAQGGLIAAANRKEGGSCFAFYLPKEGS